MILNIAQKQWQNLSFNLKFKTKKKRKETKTVKRKKRKDEEIKRIKMYEFLL